jgi:CRISPR-associated protein Csm5
MRYNIEVLSPVNIGDGKNYKEFEFFISDGKISIIDIMKLIKENSKNNIVFESIINNIDSPHFKWNEALKYTKIDLSRYVQYHLKADSISSLKGEIISFIKTAGRPFIPGSSLKGALRIALTRSTWEKTNQHYKNAIHYKRNGRIDLKHIDNIAEENVFGKLHNSPFRFLKIWDSDILPYENLGVYEMKIENICNEKTKWYSRNQNYDDIQYALPVYIEAIIPGTHIYGNYALDKLLKDKYIIEKGDIKSSDALDPFVARIQKDIREYIDEEIDFYDKHGPQKVKEFYINLKDICNKLGRDEVLLQVGFGTGYLSKTIGRLLNSQDISSLRNLSMRISDVNLFPKTRRIILNNGKPHSVPGWVKIKFTGE